MFLHVLLHSNMRGGILSCGLHLLGDILFVTVMRQNVALDQRFAVMRKYINSHFLSS
jgi:hypothetical protein